MGRPAPWPVVAAFFAAALGAWLAACGVLVAAADDLAAGRTAFGDPVLAAHLAGLGFFPLAVGGASLHVLPMLLRNDGGRRRGAWAALVLLGGGLPLAVGLRDGDRPLVWAGVALVSAVLVLALAWVATLAARAPRDRRLLASRAGVSLAAAHAALALGAGAVLFDDPAALGVDPPRLLLAHLHLAALGWLTLLIVAVGRTLAPMLARAPAAPGRRLPREELALVAGLWLLVAGLVAESDWTALAGALAALLALAAFVAQLVHVARARRTEALEGPLAHFLAGALFLVQAAVLGLLALLGGADPYRTLPSYVVLFLGGWAAGITLGHAGKLLALSAWTWWPPGPRPKQAWLYPRRAWLAEAIAFAVGLELLAAGMLSRAEALAQAGAALLAASAAIALAAALLTISRGPRLAGS